MKRKACILVFFVLVSINAYSAWTDVTISADSQLGEDAHIIVATVNGMAPDTLRVAIDGASVGTLFVNGTAEITMLGGRISSDFYAFAPENLDDDGLIRGPYENSVYLNDTSTMIMSGGAIEGGVNIAPGAEMELYGYGFQYTPKEWWRNSGRLEEWWRNGGRLQGYWQNDQPVSLYFVNDSFDRVVLHEIPEPATIAMLGLGGLLLRRRH